MSEASAEHPVVLFDGVCNVCNRSVNFIIDRDPHARLRFAALQSGAARRILEGLGRTIPPGDPDTIVLVDRSRLYEQSAAMLRIARHMRGAWPLLCAFLVIPRPLRDAVYRWAAARRYRWFGKSDSCRIPTQDLRARFLE
ncbi:MAG TPA: DCC1-like thiol-disulfide oxidoreductase family protein [Polyangiaceae bacterium]|nr:DCC1-like thiol-disulfide oxidoreductase family protein [Polyangiaceae bacterium]